MTNTERIRRITTIVAQEYDITPEVLTGRSRLRNIVTPRQTIWTITRDLFGQRVPLAEIGCYFSHRTHATVLKGVEQVRNQQEVDKVFAAKYDELLRRCRNQFRELEASKSTRVRLSELLRIESVEEIHTELLTIIETL